MFYQFMKWYLKWMIKLHFRRIYVKGAEKVPNGKPVIYASNHPAGFVEPIIMTTSVTQPVHFLVLGSFLQSPWLQWFFRGLRMVPIFRRDIAGDQSVEMNKSTFQYVYDSLRRNSHILIYPEAQTQFLYKVRPLKKGIARMSRGFLEGGTHKEMYIVPVGVNFIDPARFRSDVFIEFGEPLLINDLSLAERPWLKKLIGDISASMKKVVFDVQDESRHQMVQQLVEMWHYDKQTNADIMVPSYITAPEHVQSVRNFVRKLDKLTDEKFNVLQKKLESYNALLKRKGLAERTLKRKKSGLKLYALILFGFPFFGIGLILNGFGLAAAAWVKKNLVKRTEYKAGVSSSIPTVLTLLIFILFIILGLVLDSWFLILAFIFPFSLYILIYYYDLLILGLQQIIFSKLASGDKKDIFQLRDEIFDLCESN